MLEKMQPKVLDPTRSCTPKLTDVEDAKSCYQLDKSTLLCIFLHVF